MANPPREVGPDRVPREGFPTRVPTFHAYAHCRDDAGKRPWLHEFPTLNAAARWVMQHERQILEFNAQHGPETQVWPQ